MKIAIQILALPFLLIAVASSTRSEDTPDARKTVKEVSGAHFQDFHKDTIKSLLAVTEDKADAGSRHVEAIQLQDLNLAKEIQNIYKEKKSLFVEQLLADETGAANRRVEESQSKVSATEDNGVDQHRQLDQIPPECEDEVAAVGSCAVTNGLTATDLDLCTDCAATELSALPDPNTCEDLEVGVCGAYDRCTGSGCGLCAESVANAVLCVAGAQDLPQCVPLSCDDVPGGAPTASPAGGIPPECDGQLSAAGSCVSANGLTETDLTNCFDCFATELSSLPDFTGCEDIENQVCASYAACVGSGCGTCDEELANLDLCGFEYTVPLPECAPLECAQGTPAPVPIPTAPVPTPTAPVPTPMAPVPTPVSEPTPTGPIFPTPTTEPTGPTSGAKSAFSLKSVMLFAMVAAVMLQNM